MKLVILGLSALAAVVFAQDGIPACASTCLTLPPSCGASVSCICGDSSFINGISCCVSQKCSEADQQAALQYAQTICKSGGITLSITAAGCASTAAPSSTAASSASAAGASGSTTMTGSMSSMTGSATGSMTGSTTSGAAAAATGSQTTPAGSPTTGAAAPRETGIGLALAGLAAMVML